MLSRRFACLLAAATLVGCASNAPAQSVVVELSIPAEGVETIEQEVPLGAEVTLQVWSELGTDIHVHGYERVFSVPPGETVTEVFDATMAGAYEVESHDHNAIFMKLVVR